MQPASQTDRPIDLLCSAAEALDAGKIICKIAEQGQSSAARLVAPVVRGPVVGRQTRNRSRSRRCPLGIVKRAPAKQVNLATLRRYTKVTRGYGKHRVEWSATDIDDYEGGWSLDLTQEPFPEIEDVPISDLY